MRPYIENAGLDPVEVQAALDEQINEPFPRIPETAKVELFNYKNAGAMVTVASSSTKEMEFAFGFPMEDIGARLDRIYDRIHSFNID